MGAQKRGGPTPGPLGKLARASVIEDQKICNWWHSKAAGISERKHFIFKEYDSVTVTNRFISMTHIQVLLKLIS
jgi:hypothetical protein